MKAAVYEKFQTPPVIQKVADPAPSKNGVVLRVGACGICRSDWHGWMGNDADIRLPHVPGHELAGTVEAAGSDVKNWKRGDRVTLPFVCGCGTCPECASGNSQVCDFQFQPGFTAWGGFAEFVAIDYADANLVRLADEIDFVTASSLGCRFTTSFRAVAAQGRVTGGEWLAVWGAGGVGLSAIMIAAAFGAQVVAIDIDDEKLAFARRVGATAAINSKSAGNTIEAVREITRGGAHVSIDALGHPETCFNSVAALRKRGRHIQVGIMEAEHHKTAVPIDLVIARELEIRGSHGMQAYKYAEMLEMIAAGKLHPEKLIGKTVSLEESLDELTGMNNFRGVGLTVIDRF
jgi:alcohol dehydrogenase